MKDRFKGKLTVQYRNDEGLEFISTENCQKGSDLLENNISYYKGQIVFKYEVTKNSSCSSVSNFTSKKGKNRKNV